MLRVLDKSQSMLDVDKLGMRDGNLQRFKRLLKRSHGLMLVTGPTGSGKTTTLYAAINHLKSVEKNIVTIEDPVEYQLDVINQNQVNEPIGLSFARMLKHVLRQDPDIIMVGEIRDRETAQIAVQAALTGHLVLSTLHTNDAVGAVSRMLDMGVEPYLLASALVGVMAQRLVRTICDGCKTTYLAPRGARRGLRPRRRNDLPARPRARLHRVLRLGLQGPARDPRAGGYRPGHAAARRCARRHGRAARPGGARRPQESPRGRHGAGARPAYHAGGDRPRHPSAIGPAHGDRDQDNQDHGSAAGAADCTPVAADRRRHGARPHALHRAAGDAAGDRDAAARGPGDARAAEPASAACAEAIRAMGEEIVAGRTLAAAFTAQGSLFPGAYASLVAAAEAGGFLPEALNQLTELEDRQERLRGALIGALVYPAFLAVLSVLVVVYVLVGVFPKFAEMFEGIKDQLPRLDHHADGGVRHPAPALGADSVAAVAAIAGLVVRWVRTPSGGLLLDRAKLQACPCCAISSCRATWRASCA